MKKYLSIVILAVLLAAGYLLKDKLPQNISSSPPLQTLPNFQNITTPSLTLAPYAANLEIPWSLTFLPDNSLIFTQRAGKLRIIDQDGQLQPQPIAVFLDVKHVGEGGLLGVTIHPHFNDNRHIYFYYTYSSQGNQTLNRVVRYNLNNNELTSRKVIVDAIPGAVNHNGGRIKFGPDNLLYITTGDALEPSLAQDTSSLAGKILRVSEDGQTPSNNPFNNLIYSYGHRNPQGLAWDDKGNLWATEHGPTAYDEVNLILSGKNYGWPATKGHEQIEGMTTSSLDSDTLTWAPSGMAFVNGSLIFTGLRSQTLFQVKLDENPLQLKRYFTNQLGRLRDVVLGPDGLLYMATNNLDGRGQPQPGDDKILKVDPGVLLK